MNRITALRKQLNLSKIAFSKKFNIPYRTVQDWEAERMTPPVYVIELLEKVTELEIKNKSVKLKQQNKSSSNRITALRKRLNLSKIAFSKKFNIPYRTVQGWELNERTPPIYLIELLEKVTELEEKNK